MTSTDHTAALKLPPSLDDVALIDGPKAAAVGDISLSLWLDLVRRREAPQPAIRAHRCTRWLAREVRSYWASVVQRAAQEGAASAAAVSQRAKLASAAAKVKRAKASP